MVLGLMQIATETQERQEGKSKKRGSEKQNTTHGEKYKIKQEITEERTQTMTNGCYS